MTEYTIAFALKLDICACITLCWGMMGEERLISSVLTSEVVLHLCSVIVLFVIHALKDYLLPGECFCT